MSENQLPNGLTTLERKYLWGPDIADGVAGGAGGLLLTREQCDRLGSILDGGAAVARRVSLAMPGEVNQTKGSVTTNLIPLYDGTGHVIDIGRQKTSRGNLGPSPFYGIENSSLNLWGIYTPFVK